ncbi:hypothetical protein DAPPUDRAFT_332746 [Daphnia pulex]|uniref:Uncharacterized protein n=1 Tax=Daphnia pulex TaxID=6669 RepID=E9HQV8_DAPPU|nr:hypothetical protein DAPPUDRAFT_332746 [Daphnia pulex]|eukprot:EFX65878.1 hypothetical protein DAPPUDRAFT_332746 [Daphnia pulex]
MAQRSDDDNNVCKRKRLTGSSKRTMNAISRQIAERQANLDIENMVMLQHDQSSEKIFGSPMDLEVSPIYMESDFSQEPKNMKASFFFNDEMEQVMQDIAENQVLSTPTELIGFSPNVESILMESEFPEAEFDDEFNIIDEDDNEDERSDKGPSIGLFSVRHENPRSTIESVNVVLVGVREKIFRKKWPHTSIRLLANLPVIDWDKRFRNAPRGTSTLVSLDGTDFRIMEPTEFDPKWWSLKFKDPVLRYEVALCIRTGHIMWVNGGLPCGKWQKDLPEGHAAKGIGQMVKSIKQVLESKPEVKKSNPPEPILNDIKEDWINYHKKLGIACGCD